MAVVTILVGLLAVAVLGAAPPVVHGEARLALSSVPDRPVAGRSTQLMIRLVDDRGEGISHAIVQVVASLEGVEGQRPNATGPAIYLGGGEYYTRIKFERPGSWRVSASYSEGLSLYVADFPVEVAAPAPWDEDGQRLPLGAATAALAIGGSALVARRRGKLEEFAVVAGLVALTLGVGWSTVSYGRSGHADSPLAAGMQDPAISAHIRAVEGVDGVDLTAIWVTQSLAQAGTLSTASFDATKTLVFRVTLDHLHQPLAAPIDQLVLLRNNRRQEWRPLPGTAVESQSAHHVTALLAFPRKGERGVPLIADNDKLLELVVRGVESEAERSVVWDIYGSPLPAQAMVSPGRVLGNSLPMLFAFLLGAITFLSRCIPHTMTVFFTLVSGMSVDEMLARRHTPAIKRGVLVKTAAFVLGFTILFVIAGGTVGLLGQLVRDYEDVIDKVAGVMVIIMGLHIAGAIKMDFVHRFYPGRWVKIREGDGGSATGTFLLGSGFAVGCAACVAPQLYTVLIYASTTGSALQATVPVGLFSFGMTVPYFAAALSLGPMLDLLARVKRYLWLVPITSGTLSISLGLLMVFSNVF